MANAFKYSDPEKLKQKIDEYFGDCDPHLVKSKVWVSGVKSGEGYWKEIEMITEQKPYTISGLARSLEVVRNTLLNYEDPEHWPADMDDEIKQELLRTIKNAKSRCEEYAETQLFVGKQATGPIFNLKNNYGWKDQSEVLNRHSLVEDLDALEELDEQNQVVAAEAGKALKPKKEDEQPTDESTESDEDEPRPETEEQVVASNSPVQNQG